MRLSQLHPCFALCVVAMSAHGTLYVAPDGSDDWSGKLATASAAGTDGPFATLQRARDAMRATPGEELTVLRGGVYRIAEPLVLDARDSGHTFQAAEAEHVVISGGRSITGWQKVGDGVWRASVPATRDEGWSFRQLFVDGVRATRARTPNASSDHPNLKLTGSAFAPDRSSWVLTAPPAVLAEWGNIGDVEVVVLGNWEITRKKLSAVEPAAGRMVLAPPHIEGHSHIRPRNGSPFYLENAAEFLDETGEWYLDRQEGTVSYRPREGEDMPAASVVAPVAEQLVVIAGTAEDPVQDVTFEGITFSHTNWHPPAHGFLGMQAAFHFSASAENKWERQRPTPAIHVLHAHRCRIVGGALRHLGAVGVWLGEGCRESVVEGNDVTDVAANGIMVGEDVRGHNWKEHPDLPEDARVVGNIVRNNHVHDCGTEYFGSVGIWVGFTDGTLVSHNLAHDLPYTGVSVGWRWDPTPTACKNNIIEYNHVYDVMKVLADGGCFYTLGVQPGTIIRRNHLHHVHRSGHAIGGAPNNGIFFDQGSKAIHVEQNYIHHCHGGPIRFNQCARDWLTWGENRFEQGRGAEYPHAPELDPKTLTVEARVRLESYPGGRDPRRWIANKNKNEWEDGHYGLIVQGKEVGAYLNIGGGPDNTFSARSSSGPLSLGTWHHVAMTYDGDVLRVYHNGRECGATPVGRARKSRAMPFAIGKRQDNYVFFEGMVRDVRVYDRALTATELDANARDGAPPEADGLVREWKMVESEQAGWVAEVAEQAGTEYPYRERLSPP